MNRFAIRRFTIAAAFSIAIAGVLRQQALTGLVWTKR